MTNTIEKNENPIITEADVLTEETTGDCKDAAINLYEVLVGSGPDDIALLNDLMSLCWDAGKE